MGADDETLTDMNYNAARIDKLKMAEVNKNAFDKFQDDPPFVDRIDKH